MKYTLIIALVVLFATPAVSQNDSGIFLTIECGKKMPKQTVSLTLKQVCLASSPIILASEFVSVTALRQENQRVSFDLSLSSKAVSKLRQLAANLPSSQFALVVEKEAFIVFAARDMSVNTTFRFEGLQKDLPTFVRIQEKLKALTNGGTQ
jgi:hypothetical protein